MRACRHCRKIETDKKVNQCAGCQSHDLSEDFSGIVVVIDYEKSTIAQKMGITANGKYAVKVR